ncbi:hypothetical protein SAMN05444008_112122 [Cnuella takakiae]|uniref:Uncharacterized protein n=1 Tax=Cnuella takakiae TaxID=1302690 RepID=A0A1M5ENT7_9BACT|nr:hypothetical protein [Cnuella takakiae]OLY91247.1 hypothetical protein BUE76_04515 [Cnuella takakiae]SHF80899.1 hypothetical protein SAMN05444008_112122 [Cnuella takakiae]
MSDQQNNKDVRRDDLRQKDEGGKDVTRTGSTGGNVQAGEWQLGDEEAERTTNPDAGSYTGRGTNAGNGGDMSDAKQTT